MSTTWKPAWQGWITGGDAWEATVSPDEGHWIWDAECFHRFGSGRAPTEAEAKAAALAWIADTLREVPTRAAVALGALTGKAPVIPSRVLTEHIERYEAMHAQISKVPDSKRKTHDLAYLDGAISSLRMAQTTINAPYGPASASESATLPETPLVATERPVGLAWRETAHGWVSDDHYVWSAWATAPTQRICDWRWGVKVYAGGNAILIGGDTVESLEAAKAAAEACLRAWVARLNASLGGA